MAGDATDRGLSCLKIKQLGIDHVGMDRIRSTQKAKVVPVRLMILLGAGLEKMGILPKTHSAARGGSGEHYGCRK
jgi:hypothetical protein